MSSEIRIEFTKENIDIYLKEVAKEYRKQVGKKMPAELILVGGASVLINYGFRNMTTDIDALIKAASGMKDAINCVRDRHNLPNGWLNEDFKNTQSFTPKLEEFSVYYKTYSNVVNIRTVAAEYLIAMKLRSGRQYKSDMSDVLGILAEHENRGTPIGMKQIRKAVTDLYGEWSEYTTEVIEESDDLEVQSKTQVTENWVPMTSSTAVTASDTIRNVQKQTSGGSSYTYCPSGYEKYDGRCRKSNGATRSLSPSEYLGLSGEERKSCRQTRPTANKVVWVCGGGYSYTDLKTGYTSGYTTYSYEQLERTEETVYRSRTKDIKVTILEPTVTDYILKTDVPSGYTIVPGSERTEYSYKLSSCGTK